jgi:hypothetical protein
MLLRGLTEAQLGEFVRICRELEKFFDRKLIPQPESNISRNRRRRMERGAERKERMKTANKGTRLVLVEG